MSEARCLGPGPAQPPSRPLPRGACDSHLHVLGPFERFPLAASRPYEPVEATLTDLRAMMAATGLDRVVVAHVSACGSDLSVTLDALAQLGPQRARGTAILTPEVSDARIAELHAAGMRGVRLSAAYRTGTPVDEATVRHWAARVGPLGWHIAIWPSNAGELRLLARLAPQLPAPLVLDHLASHGWWHEEGGDREGLALLADMLAGGNTWLKLSGMYRASAAGAPWAALADAVRPLLAIRPERLLWASDWPFVGLWAPPVPGTRELLDWLDVLEVDDALRRRILVDNPEALFGFEALKP